MAICVYVDNLCTIVMCCRWCEQDFAPVFAQNTADNYTRNIAETEYKLVMEGYESQPSVKL